MSEQSKITEESSFISLSCLQILSFSGLLNQLQPNVRWSSSLKIQDKEAVLPERTFKVYFSFQNQTLGNLFGFSAIKQPVSIFYFSMQICQFDWQHPTNYRQNQMSVTCHLASTSQITCSKYSTMRLLVAGKCQRSPPLKIWFCIPLPKFFIMLLR